MTPFFLSLTANCILGFFVCWLEANLYDLPETTLTSEVHLTLAVLRLVLFLALVELSNLVILLRWEPRQTSHDVLKSILCTNVWTRNNLWDNQMLLLETVQISALLLNMNKRSSL